MADVIVTLKIMPDSPDTDLSQIKEEISKIVSEFEGEVGKTEQEPVAFGLKALKVIFVIDEAKGSTDPIEEKISKIQGVKSVEAVDVRRAIG